MKYHISHEKNGIYQGLLVEAPAEDIAQKYFQEQNPENRLLGIREAKPEDFKPGKPVLVVPEDFVVPQIKVSAVAYAEDNYVVGTVTVEGETFPFDYNLKTEELEVHCYSEPGWMTGASYEKPLPEVVIRNMEEIDAAISEAVDAYLEQTNGTLDAKLASAKAVAQDANQSSRSAERDMDLNV